MESEILPKIDFSKVRKKKFLKPTIQKQKDEDLSDIVLEKTKTPKEMPKDQENDKNKIEVGEVKKEKEIEEETIIKEDYTYEFLLERIIKMIKNNNPDSAVERGVIKMPVPVVNETAGKRSSWTNFIDFVKALNRPQDHLFQFITSELGVEGTIGGENREQVLLKARVNKTKIEQILKKYIHSYVQCPNCKSFKTVIIKDQSTRLQQMSCESCKAVITIANLKSIGKTSKK